MKIRQKSIPILVADDDLDDRHLIREAFEMACDHPELIFVKDGEELMDLLLGRGKSESSASARYPAIIVLDLNMPKIDGRDALRQIKEDAVLHDIPVIVLSTSSLDEDVTKCYALGANSYLVKPPTFEGLATLIKDFCRYWLEDAELPGRHPKHEDG